MPVAVSIKQLHKQFGDLTALNGIDLEINEGEIFGLLGPNGAGKSTLISIMAGLCRADSGQVTIMGRDVVKQATASRRMLGVVPQELLFDPFFKVREVLEIQAGYFGVDQKNRAWIDELLESLGLADKANSNMRALSGGMKRRVLIAQALVHKPRVLVLDEPTAGVDVDLRQSLWSFVERLHNDGTTVLLTTHYLEEAEALCERIGIMNHGELVALDSRAGLMKRYSHYQLKLRLKGATESLPSVVGEALQRREADSIWLQVADDDQHLDAILTALKLADIQILSLHTHEQTLEDLFLELTAGKAA
ncbi:MAG: ABC transporter ATP-binding protein [Immundisolibacteraceae bacterium]|nr:ABC transporter ATP-binding protein [Immundisolibacteraceae bacterium]